MIAYKLPSNKCEAIFGSPQEPKEHQVTIVGQKKDCSEFLILSPVTITGLTKATDFSVYDFTYNQSWGLTINADVIARVVQDLRKNAYPDPADLLDAIVKGDNVAKDDYVAKCLAVKQRFPKE